MQQTVDIQEVKTKVLLRLLVVFLFGGGFIYWVVSARENYLTHATEQVEISDFSELGLTLDGRPLEPGDLYQRGTFLLVVPKTWSEEISLADFERFLESSIGRGSESYRYRHKFQLVLLDFAKSSFFAGEGWQRLDINSSTKNSAILLLEELSQGQEVSEPTVFLLDAQVRVLGSQTLNNVQKLSPLLSKVVFESGLYDYLRKNTFFGPKKSANS